MNTRKKILVTGATGFVGKHLTKVLLENNFEVNILVRNLTKAEDLIRQGAKYIIQDLNEPFDLDCSYDVIFHCAALSSLWGEYEDFYKSNVIATQNLLLAFKSSFSKLLVHVSTPSLYFDFIDKFDVLETDEFGKQYINHYVETKKISEKIIFQEAKNIKFIIIRPRGIFGPEDSSILPRILNIAKRGYIFLSNPKALVDITYVDNLIELLVSCIESNPDSHNKIYNISNAEKISIGELLRYLFSKLDMKVRIIKLPFFVIYFYAYIHELIAIYWSKKEPSLTRYSVGILSKSLTLNIDQAKKYLGYQPKYSILEGIDIYIKWLKKNCE